MNHGLQAETAARASGQLRACDQAPTTTERLHMQRDELKDRLAQVEDAIEALEASPEVARAVDAISKVGGIY